MNEQQKRKLLEGLRILNIESIKAQETKDEELERGLTHYNKGFYAAIITAFDEGEEFLSIFMECECGHNFSLTGKETNEELEKHYGYMDAYYKFEGESR